MAATSESETITTEQKGVMGYWMWNVTGIVCADERTWSEGLKTWDSGSPGKISARVCSNTGSMLRSGSPAGV